MDDHGHGDNNLESNLKKALSRFNLKENPFQVFELYEQGLDKQGLKRDESLFRDRKDLVDKIITRISTSKS